MRALRLRSSVSSGLSLGLLIGCVAALTPACPTNTCNASNCVTGCCDSGGRCQVPSANACGLNGNVCQQCVLGQNCSAGVCTGGTTGTGGFGQGGGFSGGGVSGVGGGSSGVGGGSSGSSYSAFLTNLANAYCQYAIRCGHVTATGLSTCTDYLRLQIASGLGLPSERSVAIGASSFDTAAAATCLTELATLACSSRSTPRTCVSVGTPMAMLNGACEASRDCVSPTLTCNGASCMKRCTEGGNLGEGCKLTDRTCNAPFACINGTCVNEPPPGTPCQSSNDCGATSQCRNGVCERLTTLGASCATISCVPQAYCDSTRVCRAKLATGSSCSSSSQCETSRCVGSRCEAPGAPGASCQSDFDCQTTLSCFCQTGPSCFSGGGQCRSKGQVGAPCFRSSDCTGSLSCDDVSLTCRQATAVATGQPCSSTQACSGSTDSCRNLVVVRDGGTSLPGTCGPVQVGDACTSGFGNEWCGTAKYCNPATSRCAAAASGTPCSSSSNCLPTEYCTASDRCAAKAPAGQVCDSTSGESCNAPTERCLRTATPGQSRCQQVPEVGSPCINECVFGAFCRNGLCVASGRVGQPCFMGGCFSGVCRPDGGVGGLCDAPLANGAACRSNPECQSGSCDRGLCVAACP